MGQNPRESLGRLALRGPSRAVAGPTGAPSRAHRFLWNLQTICKLQSVMIADIPHCSFPSSALPAHLVAFEWPHGIYSQTQIKGIRTENTYMGLSEIYV